MKLLTKPALQQIETSNSRLKLELRNKGVIEESEIGDRLAAPRQEAKKSSLLVRERDFFSHKSKTSRSRVEETHLQMQLESLYIRYDGACVWFPFLKALKINAHKMNINSNVKLASSSRRRLLEAQKEAFPTSA